MSKRYVEYILVNKDLGMSVGKIAGQVAHGQTLIDNFIFIEDPRDDEALYDAYVTYVKWLSSGQKKVILRANESKLKEAIKLGGIPVYDHGLTEIPENSLTVVGFMPRYEDGSEDDFKKFIKRFQLL